MENQFIYENMSVYIHVEGMGTALLNVDSRHREMYLQWYDWHYMAVGRWGSEIPPPFPLYFANPKILKSLKITTYQSVYSNKAKIGS